MELTGDDNIPALPMDTAQVNHLRRLLAWMRCEYMLDPDMQRGFVSGASEAVRVGAASPEAASALVQQQAEQINRCPAYIRQSVKMLTKALREHDAASGVVDSAPAASAPATAETPKTRQLRRS